MNLRLIHPDTTPAERCAWLTLEPAMQAGKSLIKLVTGPDWQSLSQPKVYGPYPTAEAQTRIAQLLAQLRTGGYQELGHERWLADLGAPSRKLRALAALGLGWHRDQRAVPALLAAAGTATTELPLIIDALGRIGDPRGIALARAAAEKKLLSRRRSGAEALRNLGDAEGLALLRKLGEERLPATLLQVLRGLDENSTSAQARGVLSTSLGALDVARRGLAIDQLYELASPLCIAVTREALRGEFTQAHVWRYAKSVLKRSMLRGDTQTFAELALSIERKAGQVTGVSAVVKSGLDGESRSTRIFKFRTQRYLVRANARYLRRLSGCYPERYLETAVAILSGYRTADARMPHGKIGPFGHALMLYELLHAESTRFKRVSWRAALAYANSKAVSATWQPGDVPHHALWEQQPQHYLSIAAFAELEEARAFAIDGLARHPQVWAHASHAELTALSEAPEAALHEPALAEISARFDDNNPDLALCGALLDGGERARTCALQLLRGSVPAWIRRFEALPALLLRARESGRVAAASVLLEAARTLTSAERSALCRVLLQALDIPEVAAGEQQGALVEVLSTLATEACAGLSLDTVLALLEAPDLARRSVGGALLGVHPDALEVLGSARLVVLADSPVASIRASACALVARALPSLSHDPYPLVMLAESRYPDCRAAAFALLNQLDPATLDLDAVLSLIDSNQSAVQAFARDWIRPRLAQFDMVELLRRLSEHPHRLIRAFALELIEQALPPGPTAFKLLERFLIGSLLTTKLARSAKDRLIRVVEQRALSDPKQGAIALNILGTALRTATLRDFEPILLALTRLQLQHPGVVGDWLLLDPATC